MRSIFVLFLACTLMLPVEAQSKVRAEKLVADAKPYVETALTTSMDTLTAKAIKSRAAKDHAFLGLAMFAGRHQPEDGQEALYAQKLGNLEARLLPQSDDYVETHPHVDLHTVDWVDVLKPTSDELLVAVYYQQHYSADYWLGFALSRRNMPLYTKGKIDIFGTGAGSDGTATHLVHPSRSPGVMVGGADSVIRKEVLMTAAACVRAVRTTAGLTYQGPHDLPTIVFLMRKFPYLDIDNSLFRDENRSTDDKGYPGNAEACGTPAQLQSYVDVLKANATE